LIDILPHINVSLNALSAILLVLGFVLIKRKQEVAHRNVMLATFAVSALFLVCYLTYHFQLTYYYGVAGKKFPTDPAVAPHVARYFYYGLLLSHVLLAMAVPVLALWAIWNGLKDRREAHRRVAKWAWPIWLYVSVTGVIVYLMLYQIYVPPAA
jgi:putative membrane protein